MKTTLPSLFLTQPQTPDEISLIITSVFTGVSPVLRATRELLTSATATDEHSGAPPDIILSVLIASCAYKAQPACNCVKSGRLWHNQAFTDFTTKYSDFLRQESLDRNQWIASACACINKMRPHMPQFAITEIKTPEEHLVTVDVHTAAISIAEDYMRSYGASILGPSERRIAAMTDVVHGVNGHGPDPGVQSLTQWYAWSRQLPARTHQTLSLQLIHLVSAALLR